MKEEHAAECEPLDGGLHSAFRPWHRVRRQDQSAKGLLDWWTGGGLGEPLRAKGSFSLVSCYYFVCVQY